MAEEKKEYEVLEGFVARAGEAAEPGKTIFLTPTEARPHLHYRRIAPLPDTEGALPAAEPPTEKIEETGKPPKPKGRNRRK